MTIMQIVIEFSINPYSYISVPASFLAELYPVLEFWDSLRHLLIIPYACYIEHKSSDLAGQISVRQDNQ